MFWESVVSGLKVLTYWETYIAVLEYIAIFLIPMFVIGVVMERGERVGVAVGCLSMFILPLLQVAAMSIFIITLAPIILGISEDAAWVFPWNILFLAPVLFLKLVGVLFVAAVILSFIPILGRLNSLHTLILGGIALVFVLSVRFEMN